MDTAHMDRNEALIDKDVLYLLGGAGLVLLGAGLLLSNRTVRQALGKSGVGDVMQAAMPDVERYLKLRSM